MLASDWPRVRSGRKVSTSQILRVGKHSCYQPADLAAPAASLARSIHGGNGLLSSQANFFYPALSLSLSLSLSQQPSLARNWLGSYLRLISLHGNKLRHSVCYSCLFEFFRNFVSLRNLSQNWFILRRAKTLSQAENWHQKGSHHLVRLSYGNTLL